MKFKGPKGWKYAATEFKPGQERQAQELLSRLRAQIQAGQEFNELGPLTVKKYGQRWIESREKAKQDDEGHDETRLRKHVYPVIGDLRLDEVRPRHILEVVNSLRDKKAPRTIRNVYSVMSALFRDATIADLITATPCILRRPHLPKIVDKVTGWRAGAIYTPEELFALSHDPGIPEQDRVFYALLGYGMLRHGEAAGLRWMSYSPELVPLGRLEIGTSYDKGKPKTGAERWMPVHRSLAAILAEWKLSGWERTFGRRPEPYDLVVPRVLGPRRGLMRSKEHTHYLLKKQLAALKFRHRRGHDLRRTGISLAQEGGADRDVLKLCTHKQPGDVMSLYTTLGWGKLCAQVSAVTLGVTLLADSK